MLLYFKTKTTKIVIDTDPIHQTKLFVRQLLFLGHYILGQFQQRILVTPQQLADAHFDERFHLQNVHNTGHGQP